MKIRAALLVVMLSTKALADPVPHVEAVPPGDDKIVVLMAGNPAPYTGQLFENATALRWANWLEQYRHLLETTVEHDQQVCAIKLEYDATALKLEQDRGAALSQDLKRRLADSEKARAKAEYEVQNPPWYRTVWFGVSAGVVTSLATVLVVSSALAKTR